ncbi:MAG TPA: hypothetical protein VEW94_06040, partial [Chloroflexia bacterium]|nr:hypothetical protein [Chloroflexia bacterium]
FEAGRAAYAQGDWAGAKEMLTEVVRQEPEYGRDGQFAINMLHDIERKQPPVQPPVKPIQAAPPAQPAPPITREPSPPVQPPQPEYRVAATPPQPQPQIQAQTHHAVAPQTPTEAPASTLPYTSAVPPPQTYAPPVQSRSRNRMGLTAAPVILLLLLGLFGGIAVWFQSQSASPGTAQPTATATEQALAAAETIETAEANPTFTEVVAPPTPEKTRGAQPTEPPSPTTILPSNTASPTSVADAGPSDPPGITDFKLIPRPEDSYIDSWCITGFCSDALTATGLDGADQDRAQNLIYHRTDESGYDADKLLAFYIDTLTKQGWTLDKNIAIGSNKGQIFRPPAELKSQIRKVGIYFWGSGGNLYALTVAIIHQEPIGYPPDISLFVEDPVRDGTAPAGSGPTPVIGSAGTPSPDDPPGLTDFKLVPRPADSIIVSWCIVGFCSEGLAATGTNTYDADLTQHVVYRRADKSDYDAHALLRFYITDLRAKGWTLGNNVRIGENIGQIFLPPESIKGQLRKIGVYFWSESGGTLNNVALAIVHETPLGYPP